MSLDSDLTRLVETLNAMVVLLRQHGNDPWAEQIERCRANIEQSDYYGIERLLGLYGGMGSLNDVVLSSESLVDQNNNDAFAVLRGSAWDQARALERDESHRDVR